MTLAELLDELRRNVLRDTSTSLAAPDDDQLLWDDASLVRYINDAYFKFARRTLCIRDDSTTEVVQITLAEGVVEYPLHGSVLAVYSVTREDGTPLTVDHHNAIYMLPSNVVRASASRPGWCPGAPTVFTTDAAVRKLVIRAAPDETYAGQTLSLRVARLPLVALEDIEDEPEVDGDYHLDLLEWAAYRAYRNHDVDAENLIKASAHKKHFNEIVDEARASARRREFEPMKFEPNAPQR